MNNKTLYSAVFDGEYPFAGLFKKVTTVTRSVELSDPNSCLIIWGGGDISPTLYKHGVSPRTHTGAEPSNRDVVEWALAERAVAMGIPIIGICRGAQMMCAMSGGSLIQDVDGHTRDHDLKVIQTGEVMTTSSLHHQMMFPWNIEHKMIATAYPMRSNHYLTRPLGASEDLDLTDIPCEPEIVWFPQTKALAIQGHPEFCGIGSTFVQYCFDLASKYVYGE